MFEFSRYFPFPALLVQSTLKLNMFQIGIIKFIPRFRITQRIFVDVGGTVSNPLPGSKNGHFTMELEFHHFKGGSMTMPHKIANEPSVLGYFAGSFSITHPCRLDNGIISSHKIHQADETFI